MEGDNYDEEVSTGNREQRLMLGQNWKRERPQVGRCCCFCNARIAAAVNPGRGALDAAAEAPDGRKQ